ncbi:hypothetical protein TNCV_2370801 [Trichonephila clavipes]|nr:hypothetical protein TNCV_2370801 [Trichonephila clavipes]
MGSDQVTQQVIQRNYHTRIRVAGKCLECTVGNVIPYATVRRRFGDIHSAGHSIANHHKKTPDRTSFNNDRYRNPINVPSYNTRSIILCLNIQNQTFIDQRT